MRDGEKPRDIFIRPNLIITVYIDDIIIIGRYKLIIQKFKSQLSKRFNIKDLGETTDYLSIEIKRNKAAGILKIHQSRYYKALLKKYRIDKYNLTRTPIHDAIKLYIDNPDK